jgi:tRNA threonylcarbamoyladenosine biosynthesis protein TsaB
MLLLVADTSGKQGYVALVRAEEARAENSGKVHTIESVPLEGGTFSAQLVPQIAGLLTKHGFGKSDVDAFIVISGPGSFTGLRVGLAAIKALAEILGKPIVAVSLLEVIALASGKQGKVLSALDAGRNEVYAGEYEVVGEDARRVAEQLLTRGDFLAAARSATVATPHEALLKLAQEAGLAAVLIASPDAAAVARCGKRKLQAGETVAPDQLEANYIRRSDAEIFAKPGMGS